MKYNTYFIIPIILLTSFHACTHKKKLRFSDTQTLGRGESEFLKRYVPKIKLSEEDLKKIPKPHSNNSMETQNEIKDLLSLQASRKQSDIEIIERQKRFCRFRFPAYEIGKNKSLDSLLASSFFDTSYYIFKLKVKYDRVRPNFLEAKLKLAIENPAHPAYPSGHAGQSMITSLILAEVFPNKKDELLKYAEFIGRNREVAGVHYNSDTAAGQKIARIYFNRIRKTHLFKDAINNIFKELPFKGTAFTELECEEFMLSNKIQRP